jgi:hypothetical protein
LDSVTVSSGFFSGAAVEASAGAGAGAEVSVCAGVSAGLSVAGVSAGYFRQKGDHSLTAVREWTNVPVLGSAAGAGSVAAGSAGLASVVGAAAAGAATGASTGLSAGSPVAGAAGAFFFRRKIALKPFFSWSSASGALKQNGV